MFVVMIFMHKVVTFVHFYLLFFVLLGSFTAFAKLSILSPLFSICRIIKLLSRLHCFTKSMLFSFSSSQKLPIQVPFLLSPDPIFTFFTLQYNQPTLPLFHEIYAIPHFFFPEASHLSTFLQGVAQRNEKLRFSHFKSDI